MAFDSKRLRMFKWLQSLADGKAAYCKDGYNPFNNILVYCGSLYATNSIVLAKIDYPEFEHLSDYVWSNVTRFCDDNGYLLETPEIEERERQFNDYRYFDRFFIGNESEPFHAKIDPRVIDDCMKPFKISRIKPCVYTDRNKIEFAGHNNDVSIKVVMMGVG